MPSSSTSSGEIERVEYLLGELLGTGAFGVEELTSGANSRVYLVTQRNGDRLVAKVSVDRNRLSREFRALEFLRDGDVDQIPEPVALHSREALAVYGYVDGNPVGSPREADIDSAVGFISTLRKQTVREEASNQPSASEACFSLEEIARSIGSRLERLQSEEVSRHEGLDSFLSGALEPAFERIVSNAREITSGIGNTTEDVLPERERVLSPSDFGFHNTIRMPDDSLVYVDFEHFGWDDPAKTISDFVLHPHPAMAMSDSLRRRFVSQMVEAAVEPERLRLRLAMVYPLYGLKWCTILLNEFVPRDLARRTFADENHNAESRRQAQLRKARHMLHHVNENGMEFPYFEEGRGL